MHVGDETHLVQFFGVIEFDYQLFYPLVEQFKIIISDELLSFT